MIDFKVFKFSYKNRHAAGNSFFIAPSKCLQQQQLLQFNLQKVGDVTAIFEISNLLSIRKSLISRLIRK